MKQNDFLNIIFAILQKAGQNYIDINYINELIKIISQSKELEKLRNKILLLTRYGIDIDELSNNSNFIGLTEDGIIYFQIAKEEEDKILEENKVNIEMINYAIFVKKLATGYEIMKNNKAKIEILEANGIYKLCYTNNPFSEYETQLYTDGKITKVSVEYPRIKNGFEEKYDIIKTVEVNNATYSIKVDYLKNIPQKTTIRGAQKEGLYVSLMEAELIETGETLNYKLVSKEKPRVYELKKH